MIRCIKGKSCHSADTLMQSPKSSSDIMISTKTVYQELRGKGFHDPCHKGSWSCRCDVQVRQCVCRSSVCCDSGHFYNLLDGLAIMKQRHFMCIQGSTFSSL